VGSNRDEFVVVRKMRDVNWMEGPRVEAAPVDAARVTEPRPAKAVQEVREPALALAPGPKAV